MFHKTKSRFFEDFRLGETIFHATPRTLNDGDRSLYGALYGGRFAVQSSKEFALAIGYSAQPMDDLLVFNNIFGKTVADISLNAVANLGYAQLRFFVPVFTGDTLSAKSTIIGLKENAHGQSGIVYVHSQGFNQRGTLVLEFVRWVMVKKRDFAISVTSNHVPDLDGRVDPTYVGAAVPLIDVSQYNTDLSGSSRMFGDYDVGEKIDHEDGVSVEEAEHMMATRLYQNTAKVHFDGFMAKNSRFGRRLIYGGHVISIARALSFNGLANAFHIAAINGGNHLAPLFAGDTVYAWSEILEKSAINNRQDIGALRIRTIATRDLAGTNFPDLEHTEKGGLILELDYWVVMPIQ